jgi:iron complex outermembrane receptor protein
VNRSNQLAGAVSAVLLGAVGVNAAVAAVDTSTDSGGAPTGLEEVIVTAQKRAEKAQDVPMSMTTFSEAALEKIGFARLTDLGERAPSLDLQPNFRASSQLKVYMRGVGQESPEQLAKDNGVGVYLDDVYVGHGMGLSSELADVERIEVLPGPQGTLYGRNTIGGAIKFIPSKPTGVFGIKQSLDVGNFGYLRSATNINLPEVAHLSAKLSVIKSEQDGWVKNIGSGKDFGDQDNLGYRVALRWQPVDTFTADYTYDHTDNQGTSTYQQHQFPSIYYRNNPFPMFTDRQERSWRAVDLPLHDDFEGSGHALTMDWDVSDTAHLKSVTAYREYESSFLNDTVEAFNVPVVAAIDSRQHQFSQELLLSGSLQSAPIKYHLGAFHFEEGGRQLNNSIINGVALAAVVPYVPPTLDDLVLVGDIDVRNESQAVYGQLTWVPPILDNRFTIDLGGRYSWDSRELEQYQPRVAPPTPTRASGSADYTSFDPSLTVDYKWTAEVHTYVKVAKAYISGGFDPFNNVVPIPYKPERLLSIEAGIKSQWFDNRMLFNLAAFRSDYEDIQLRFLNAALVGTASGGFQTVNGGQAIIKGLELQFEAVPVQGLTVSVGAAYLEDDATVTNPFTGVTAQSHLPNAPKWKADSSLEYVFAPLPFGTASLRGSYSFHDQQLTSGGGKDFIPSYSLIDARLTLSEIPVATGDLSVSLWGRNLTDEEYQVYHGAAAVVFGLPRSYGLNVLYKY